MIRTNRLRNIALDQGKSELPSIRKLAAKHGIDFGIAVQSEHLTDAATRDIIKREAALLVPENEMQIWHTNPASSFAFEWDDMDAIAAYATRWNKKLKGHALVWHFGLPGWCTDWLKPSNYLSVIQRRAEAIFARYGELDGMDAVNEAIATNGSGFRTNSAFYTAAGNESYIADTFQIARDVWTTTPLGYCDFGVEQTYSDANTDPTSKRANVLSLLDTLSNAGTIDYFASQTHPFIGSLSSYFSESVWRTFCADVRSMGLKMHISEFDIFATTSRTGESLDYAASELTKRLIGTWLEGAQSGEQLIVWGIKDDLSWRQGQNAYLQRPLPWDADGKPKWMERTLRQLFA